MEKFILAALILITISTSQAQWHDKVDKPKYSRAERVLDTTIASVYTACVVEKLGTSIVLGLGQMFAPEATVNIYYIVPFSNRRINITQQVIKAKEALCPFLLEGLSRFK